MCRLVSLCLILLVANQVQASSAWDLNDVSYLLPLPKIVGRDSHLTLDTPARGGNLLPSHLLEKLPSLALHLKKEEALASTRVLAVRIDPCFPLPTPQSCQRQMRLVWQPFENDPWAAARTVDAALHSFYVLTDIEFTALLKDLAIWKTKYSVNTTRLPLQIHPAWGPDGEQSAALADFQQIVVKYAGLQNLSRVTAMVLRGAGDIWTFAGFEIREGQLILAPIPRLDRQSQAFANFAIPFDHFQNAQISPAAQGPQTINNLILNSDELKTGYAKELKSEFQVLAQFENPHIFNPENLDCVSCHITQQVRNWGVKARADLQLADIWNSLRYQNYRYDLSNVTESQINTRNIRAFGFFGREATVSQRVINESAVVADAVNAWVK